MSLPNPISPGQPISADWLNRLRAEVLSNTIRSSPNTLVQRDSAGTTLTPILPQPLNKPGFLKSTNPWQIFQYTADAEDTIPSSLWRNVRVHIGYVNGITTTASVFCHDADGGDLGTYDILVPENATDYKIWGTVDYTRSAFCSTSDGSIKIDAVQIEHGTSWWSGHPGQYATPGVFHFEIGTVSTGVDAPQWLDSPDNTDPNPDYHRIDITQICDSDQYIYSQPILLVNLATDGGEAGDASTDCDLTYAVTDLCGTTLGAGMTPITGRMPGMQYTVGTVGYATWDEDGELQLAVALDELPVPTEVLIMVAVSKEDGCYTVEPHKAKLLGYDPAVTEPA